MALLPGLVGLASLIATPPSMLCSLNSMLLKELIMFHIADILAFDTLKCDCRWKWKDGEK